MNLGYESERNFFQVKPYGPLAWLISVDPESKLNHGLHHLAKAVDETSTEIFQEYILGFDAILFVFREPVSREFVEEWLRQLELLDEQDFVESRLIEVPVKYGDDDLAVLAKAKGMSVEEVVRRHSSVEYRVRILGFSPGFPYLDGLDKTLCLPRKRIPSPRIEAGSVAIGGSHAGIYSIASPGGWYVLGRTPLTLFEPDFGKGDVGTWDKAFSLKPGDRIRFKPL